MGDDKLRIEKHLCELLKDVRYSYKLEMAGYESIEDLKRKLKEYIASKKPMPPYIEELYNCNIVSYIGTKIKYHVEKLDANHHAVYYISIYTKGKDGSYPYSPNYIITLSKNICFEIVNDDGSISYVEYNHYVDKYPRIQYAFYGDICVNLHHLRNNNHNELYFIETINNTSLVYYSNINFYPFRDGDNQGYIDAVDNTNQYNRYTFCGRNPFPFSKYKKNPKLWNTYIYDSLDGESC